LEAIIVAVIALAKESWSEIQNIPRRTSISTSVSRNLKSDKDQLIDAFVKDSP
jgi:hypothetical protein